MVKIIPQTLIVQYTVPANLPANSVVVASIIVDPQTGSVQRLQIPPTEIWSIDDVYKVGTINIDAVAQILKNDFYAEIVTDPLSTLDVSNPAKPKYPKKLFRGNEALTIKMVTLKAQGASATTDTFYMKVTRFTP